MTYQATVLADTPIRYYRLDTLIGTSEIDLGSQLQSATINGGVTLGTPGLIRYDSDTAETFDGLTGYLSASLTNIFSAGQSLSVEIWANITVFGTDANGTNHRLIHCNSQVSPANGFQIAAPPNGEIAFTIWDNDVHYDFSSGGFLVGTSYHLVFTYDATSHTVLFYANGVLQTNDGTQVALSLTTTTGFNIGRRTNAQGYFAGILDEVAIYQYVLTGQQVLNHYTHGVSGITPYQLEVTIP